MPIGAPGWPELACCTASIESARMALAISVSRAPAASGVAIGVSGESIAAMCGSFLAQVSRPFYGPPRAGPAPDNRLDAGPPPHRRPPRLRRRPAGDDANGEPAQLLPRSR